MTTRDTLIGLGAFGAGLAALFAAAVVGEAYVGRLPQADEDDAPAAPAEPAPALIEAPHVAETRDGPVDTAPGAPGVTVAADGSPEHVPTDLIADTAPGRARAPDAFRPDPTAAVPAAMRDSLRPATGPAKAFAANEGDTVTEPVNAG